MRKDSDWVHIAIPSIYSDALSYMEAIKELTKVVAKIAKLINTIPEDMQRLILEYVKEENLCDILNKIVATYNEEDETISLGSFENFVDSHRYDNESESLVIESEVK